ncbi:Gfo/Idh/MocA family protein [Nocardioides mesophilus]|uniref:Gfo/Idh/MocA family oxidoreductase n=1 Tax=Nocardioides mesophilus TaxID=433659 RepID=A0A7G9RFL4_9ACTN|nr:Gfo/Idh/MocA family oxidoreductase [Nocardioides mesophilus]QNN54389.1 Gfo/Idh/MocA family oxidoreductase [Nocardioides mesophilus]
MKALILGSGRMAAIRAAALRDMSGVELVFATRDRSRAEALGKEFGGLGVALDDVASESPDAVFVTSATARHRSDLELALRAGVPVLIEKPLGASVEESEALAASADTAGVPVIVGFQRRFDDGFAALKTAIDSGAAGRLYLMRSASMDHTPGREEFIAASAGIYHDLFVHDIETAMWLTGQEVRSVYAVGGSRVSQAYADHGDSDVATIIAHLEDGLTVTMHGVRHDPLGQDVRWEIYGSEMVAAAGLSRRTPILAVEEPSLAAHHPPLTFAERFAGAFAEETRSFLRSVADGGTFLGCTAHEAVLVSRVAEACARSSKLGVTVPVGA